MTTAGTAGFHPGRWAAGKGSPLVARPRAVSTTLAPEEAQAMRQAFRHEDGESLPEQAFDISDDGTQVAYAWGDSILIGGKPFGPVPHGKGYRLPDLDLAVQYACDVEFLPTGRVGVETTKGTYEVLDVPSGAFSPVSLKAFDSQRWETRCAQARRQMPDLAEEELTWLLDRYGTTVVAAFASPDSRQVLVQLQRPEHQRANMLIHRPSGQRFSLGPSDDPDPARPETTPRWTPDGLHVILDGDTVVEVPVVPESWAERAVWDEGEATRPAGQVIQEDDYVIVGGVKVPRRQRD